MMKAQGNSSVIDLKARLMYLVEDLMYQKERDGADAAHGVSYSKPTQEAQCRLDEFLETVEVVLKQAAPKVTETTSNSWAGEVDRQGGSFTAEEIENAKAWR